jgi:hypothetical protein
MLGSIVEEAHHHAAHAQTRADLMEAFERADRYMTLTGLESRVRSRGNHFHLVRVT